MSRYIRKGIWKFRGLEKKSSKRKCRVCGRDMKFDPNSKELVEAFAKAIEKATQKIDFDLKCLDWFSYNPDFYIREKDIKAVILFLIDISVKIVTQRAHKTLAP